MFVPVAFMYGVAGQWFKPFALTIAAAVLVSLFVSFSLDPMMSAYWPDPQIEKGQARGPVGRALGAFNAWFDRQADRYKGVVAWALDHRWMMLGLAAASFFGAIFLQGAFGGAGFVPISDRSEVSLIVQTPPGSSLEYTRAKVEEANAIVRAHPEVRYIYSSIGTPIPLQAPGVDQALVYVRLTPKADRDLSPGRRSGRSFAASSGASRARISRCSRAASAARSSRSSSSCAGRTRACSRSTRRG